MKTSIALALWLAAGGYAWADETVSPEAAPAKSAAAPPLPPRRLLRGQWGLHPRAGLRAWVLTQQHRKPERRHKVMVM
nr:hypothetical protein pPsy0462a_00072 [Pseudomonas syringae]